MRIDKKAYALALARACMTQKDIIAAGVPRGTFGRIYQGNGVKPQTAGKIAKALGVDVTEIIEKED